MYQSRLIALAALAGSFPTSAALGAGPTGSLSLAGGSIIGFVSNGAGAAQMGATVLLFNRFERLVKRATTNDRGAFGFDALPADVYSVRVSLSPFMPASRQNISVQGGVRNFLSINLATVLSSIELVYAAPGQGAIMNDDWKWVLRGSMATRPILRYLPAAGAQERRTVWFTDTRGVVKVSAGDGGVALGGDEADLGTAFAVATSFLGANQLQFSGNFGYGAHGGGLPSTGFQTKYSRSSDDGLVTMNPQVQLTMRQVYLPTRSGTALQRDSMPAMRTLSAQFSDRAQIADGIELVYGAGLESVQFFDRLNFLSPFARLSYSLGDAGTVLLGYSSGLPPSDAAANPGETDFNQDLSSLAIFPRISMRANRAHAQRTENYEAGYQRDFGSLSMTIGAYKERITNGALIASGASGGIAASDLLPDLFSPASIFNIGSRSLMGFAASASQELNRAITVSGGYGYGGVLTTADDRGVASADPADVRDKIRATRRNWAATSIAATVPGSATKVSASYMFVAANTLTPAHRSLTQRFTPDAGLNLRIRQPVPSLGILPGRLEVHAELRNMLAQGYLPLTLIDGRRILLMQNARAVRGGVSFVF